MTVVYLSIGSNVERELNIKLAIHRLGKAFPGMEVSPVYESEAVGFDGDPFLNLIVRIETELRLSELSCQLKTMETELGRQRQNNKFSARTIDIDIVLYGKLKGEADGIELPRPELYYNAFVLKPLVDLAPNDIDPKSGMSFSELDEQLALDQPLWPVSFSF